MVHFSSSQKALAGRQSGGCPNKLGVIRLELIVNEPFNVLAHLQAPILSTLATARKELWTIGATNKQSGNLSEDWTNLDVSNCARVIVNRLVQSVDDTTDAKRPEIRITSRPFFLPSKY